MSTNVDRGNRKAFAIDFWVTRCSLDSPSIDLRNISFASLIVLLSAINSSAVVVSSAVVDGDDVDVDIDIVDIAAAVVDIVVLVAIAAAVVDVDEDLSEIVLIC